MTVSQFSCLALFCTVAADPEPERIAKLIRNLRGNDVSSRIAAANELATLGEAAEESAAALCEASGDSSKRVSAAALAALEKVRPDLYPHVSTVVLDSKDYNRLQAIDELGRLGSKATFAVGLVVNGWKRELAGRRKSQFKNGFTGVEGRMIHVIVQIDTNNDEFVEMLQKLAGRKYQGSQTRADALRLLMKWAAEGEEGQKKLFDLVQSAMTDEACQLACVEIAGDLGAIAKPLLPQITKLKQSPQKKLREAAETAVQKIETANR